MFKALGVGPQVDVSRIPRGSVNVVVYLQGDEVPHVGKVLVEAAGPSTAYAGELVRTYHADYNLAARAEAQPPVVVDFTPFASNNAVVLYGRYETDGRACANAVGNVVVA
jgi:hypothetical protein